MKSKQAEPLSIEEENLLWEQNLLGDHSPQALLDTMMLLCGKHFALRSDQEHRTLQISQFELVKPASEPPDIIYYENFSKTNSGGLSNRKVKPKQVIHHSNMKTPSRCLVNLYQKYLEHRPDTKETSFYLTPLKNPNPLFGIRKYLLATTPYPKL